MDNLTHTSMEGLVLRASKDGSAHGGMRRSYYANDGSNNPPLSPTAKWKGDAHAYQDAYKDPNRFPYLPHPYPLQRKGRTQGAHPGGFESLLEPQQPPKFPGEEQVYSTYAEWWQAQRPPGGPLDEKDATFSTSFWPYGRRISCVASMDKEDQFYHLDKRIMKQHAYYKERRDPLDEKAKMSSTGFSRSQSAAELMGSQAEHLGYNRSMGQSVSSQMNHTGAHFHTKRREMAMNPDAVVKPGSLMAQSPTAGKNMWESMKNQPASSAGFGGAPPMGRSGSVPNSSRSQMEAQARGSRYEPKQQLRDLGLGSKTHAEWCLPQPPAYKPFA